MSGIQTYTPTVLDVTERAVAKVQSLKSEEGNDDLKLRVYVTGGGCSGFQYGFSFEDPRMKIHTEIQNNRHPSRRRAVLDHRSPLRS